LQGLDEKHENEETKEFISLKEHFLQCKTNGEAIFQDVSQYNSKRVCFLTTMNHAKEGQAILDGFLDDILPFMPTEEARKHVFPGRKPIRVGRRELPEEISFYLDAMPAKVVDLTEEESSDGRYRTPPNKSSGNRTVSYAEAARTGTPSRTTSQTQESTVSSPTMGVTLQSEYDKKFKEMTAQMSRQMTAMSDQRKRMAEQQETSNKRFLGMEEKLSGMLDMIQTSNNNQEKLQDSMEKQQTELAKLSLLLSRLVEPSSPQRKKRATPAKGAATKSGTATNYRSVLQGDSDESEEELMEDNGDAVNIGGAMANRQ